MNHHASAWILQLLIIASILCAAEPPAEVVVYGGTAGGVIAAVAAASDGCRVVLIEPGDHLGGMTGGGIGTIDYGVRATVGGLTDAYFRTYHPPGSIPNQAHLEAGLWRLVTQHAVHVITGHRLKVVRRSGVRITAISVEHAPPDAWGIPVAAASGEPELEIAARVFIDASYEGDLMAGAQVPYAVGREARATYNESLAGRRLPSRVYPVDPWVIPGDHTSGLLPLVQPDDGAAEGDADNGIPACNFRLQLSTVASERVPFPEFGAYDSQQYEILGRWYAARAPESRPALPFAIYHGVEFNDQRDDLVSLAFVGGMRDYIDGDWATRARIWREHARYTVGLFRFLASDARVPAELRAEAAALGLNRAAFPATQGWPHQLYLRQGRRLRGAYVMTQADVAGGSVINDTIGLGSYKVDLYNCRRYVATGGIALEGKVFTALGADGPRQLQDNNGAHAYPIPYRALIPPVGGVDNLLVPVCLSASNVAMSSLRMEPVYMLVGEAAGRAAAQVVAENCATQAIDVARLRAHLRDGGQVLSLP